MAMPGDRRRSPRIHRRMAAARHASEPGAGSVGLLSQGRYKAGIDRLHDLANESLASASPPDAWAARDRPAQKTYRDGPTRTNLDPFEPVKLAAS
jgi:hypothetical protein